MKRLILFVFILFGCNDKPEIEIQTIYPLPYLPVYPGSYWTYLNEFGDTIHSFVEDEYKTDRYQSYELNGNYTDNAFVPFWNGLPIYGYSTPEYTVTAAYHETGKEGKRQLPILKETKGYGWRTYSSQYGSSARWVVAVDTTIVVNSITYNNVIVVNDSGYSYQGLNTVHSFGRASYFAKDVGLIREDRDGGSGIIIHLSLIDYFINH
jgi:hypothetical protein